MKILEKNFYIYNLFINIILFVIFYICYIC